MTQVSQPGLVRTRPEDMTFEERFAAAQARRASSSAPSVGTSPTGQIAPSDTSYPGRERSSPIVPPDFAARFQEAAARREQRRAQADQSFLARANSRQTLPALQQAQPGGMPSTTASQLQRPGSLENLGGTIGDFAQAGADFIQSAPYGAVKDAYDQAAGFGARLANNPTIGRAMEAVGLRPDLANDTSGYQPDVQPPDSIAGQLGRGVGSIGSMFAASALTGGAPVILPLVAGAQSLGATYQAARDRALQMGADEAQAHQIAAAEADTMGLVSTVTSLPVGKALSGIAPQALAKAVATANRGGQLGQLVRTAVAEGSQEAMEEASQMILQRVAEDDPAAFQDWQKRISLAAGGGAIGGGLMAGVQAVGGQQGQRQAPQDYPAQRGALASFSPQNAQQVQQPIPRGEQAGPEASVEAVEQGWPSELSQQQRQGDLVQTSAAESFSTASRGPTPYTEGLASSESGSRSTQTQPESLVANMPGGDIQRSTPAPQEPRRPESPSVPSNLSSLTIAELRSLDLQRGGTGKGTKAAVLKRLQQPAQPTRPTGSESASPAESPRPADQSQSLSSGPAVQPSQPPATTVREPWEMTRAEIASVGFIGYDQSGRPFVNTKRAGGETPQLAANHEEAISRALSEGRPVPPEVLADYPDLQPKAPAPQQPSRAEAAAKPKVNPELQAFRDSLKKVEGSKGKRYADTLQSQWPRLSSERGITDGIHEYRNAGYVTKSSEGKYLLHPVAGTDGPGKNWRILDPIDVTSQYASTPTPPAPVEGGGGANNRALQTEHTDQYGKFKRYGDAVDPTGNWKRLKELPDDSYVALYHATSRQSAESILREGYRAKKSAFTDTPPDYVYLGGWQPGAGGLGTYIGHQGKGDPALVVFRVKKSDLEADAGTDWKSHLKGRDVRKDIKRLHPDASVGNPPAWLTYAQINQVRAHQSVAQPIGMVDLATGKYSPAAPKTQVEAQPTTPAPKDMAALRAKYPGVTFKPVRGVYIPSTLKGKALAEWRNTASGKPFKDQIALLDARLQGRAAEQSAGNAGRDTSGRAGEAAAPLPGSEGRAALSDSADVTTARPSRQSGTKASEQTQPPAEQPPPVRGQSESPSQPPSTPEGSPKSRADKIVETANKIADEAKKRRQERTITRKNKPGERTGGSPLIPDAIDFGIEIAARAVAKGITGGQALTKHISAALKTLPEELKPYGGRVRYVARRVVLGATKNGVFQPSLMADSIQTERLRHAENDETVKARQKLHKIVGGTDKAKAEPKLRQEIDENLGVRKAPTYTVGGPVDLESLLPEHRYAIATLYTSVKRGKAISGTNEAAEFIQAQTEKGLANLFTPEMLAELRGLEGRGAKGGMTPDQMDLISKAIQHVAHLSKTERTATVLGQIRQLDEDGAAVVGELEGRVDIPKQGLLDKAMGRAEKEPNPGIVRRFLVRAQDSLGDMLHVAFGDGVMKKYGYEAIAKAEGAKRLEYIKADKKLREVLTRHKVKAEDVGKATKNPTTFNLPNAGEVKIPAMEALDVVLMAGDQQNTALLVENGVVSKRFQGQGEKKIDLTEADIEALGQQLPRWLMDFGRTGVEIINGYTDQVNATSVAIDGVEIAQKRTGSDYYYPRTPDPVLRTAGVRQDEMMELAWAERLGFTKKRTGSSVPYQIKPAIERIRDHIDGVTTYIHMAEPTLNVRKLIARPEVLENVQKRLGTAWRKKLLRHLNESQGMIAPPESEIQGAARWLLRNTARTALWGRLSSAMAQTAGVPMLMNRMTGKERAHFLKHLAKLDWVKNPTVMREMTEASGYFADRYPETGEQTRLGSGIDFESTIPTTPMGRWYNEALRAGFKPMEYGDKVLSALAYMAAKDAGHPDPVFRAEMLIRQSQNATSPMDRSGMMLEGERNALVGALALFSSAPNRVRGQIRADLSDVRANPKDGKAWAKLAATVLAAGIAAVMGESIRELWRRQKVGFSPEDKPRTGTDHLVNTLATLGDSIVPKGGQILRGAINGVRGKVSQTFDAPGMDLADSLGKLLGHLDADEEKAKRLGPNIDRALRAFTSFTGIVGEPVYDLGVGIARTVNPPASIAAYSAAIRRNDIEEARRIAAELRKANPKIDLKARRKNYEERVGIRKPQK